MKTTIRSSASSVALAVVGLLLCGLPARAQQPAVPAESTGPAADSSQAATQTLASGESGARIVRLSDVKGDVTLDRRTERGFEAAFANLPIVQGGRLKTGDGAAEVEFEDNSTLRVTPNSLVEFPVLKLGRDGGRVTTVRLLQGSMYVSLLKGTTNDFTVTFANQTLTLGPASHILLDLSAAQPRLAVMDSSVQVADAARTTVVGRKKGLLFDPTGRNAPVLISKNEDGPYAEWDKESVEYHKRAASNAFRGASPYAYGISDLSYYGSFTSVNGCGSLWRPYLAGAGFDPFGNGTWAWYPGAGYSFVSPYPWGWVPFHSGSWSFCPGSGWGWQPGGGWNGLRNATVPLKTPHGPTRLKLPHTVPLGSTLVPVHQTPLVASKAGGPNTFVFRNDSAGLGVPRGVFHNLGKVSAQAAQHGSVAAPVYTAPLSTGSAASGAGNTTPLSAGSARGSGASAAAGSTGRAASPGGSSGSPGGSVGGAAGGSSGGGHGSGGGTRVGHP